ncbi:MAG: hypothetical protein LBG19_11955 [Prevotellaceae bacterium]|jgi:hypothetical protein|nr:hypothetical protein [Prevotellaceae bacterium]
MEKKFTEKESLDLIVGMIENAKTNVRKGLGKHFLLWGYLVTFAGLMNFIFWGKSWAFLGWLGMLPIGIIGGFIIGRRNAREARYYTHIDKIVGFVWTGFSISLAVITFAVFNPFMLINLTRGNLFFFYPSMLTIAAIALFISGKAYQFKPLIYGAFICWACAVICYFTELRYDTLIYVIGFMLGYIIPGHMIMHKGSNTNRNV